LQAIPGNRERERDADVSAFRRTVRLTGRPPKAIGEAVIGLTALSKAESVVGSTIVREDEDDTQ